METATILWLAFASPVSVAATPAGGVDTPPVFAAFPIPTPVTVTYATPGVVVQRPFASQPAYQFTPDTTAPTAVGHSTSYPVGTTTGHIITPAVPVVRRGVTRQVVPCRG